MPSTNDGRKLLDESRERLLRLEADFRDHQRKVETELMAIREMLGQEQKAREFLRKLTVNLGDSRDYDHDTIVLMDDRERGWLRRVLAAASRDEVHDADHAIRKAWHETIWGRSTVVIMGLGFTLSVAYDSLMVLHGKV